MKPLCSYQLDFVLISIDYYCYFAAIFFSAYFLKSYINFSGFELETRLVTKEKPEAVEVKFTLEKLFHYFLTKYDISTLIKITSIDLSNCKLKDLPPECSVLNLKQINLSHNRLERIPAFLYNGHKTLELLDLSYNRIRDFDREPDCINNIKIINLSNNKLSNVPKWFLMFKAVSLQEFNYSNNAAKHYNYFKNSFNSTRNRLLKLVLKSCHLLDNDFTFLRQFKHLRYLDIGNDQECTSNIFGEIDEVFVKLKWNKLVVLKLEYLGISIFPTGILWLETLIELHLSGNCMSWLPDDIQYMINLQVLDVSKNSLGCLPVNLITLNDLIIIKASCNFLQVCPDFRLMPQLEVLDLYNNCLEEVSINLANMKFVDLEYNFLNTEKFDFFEEYVKKRNKYREIGQYRKDGSKLETGSECDFEPEKEDVLDEYSSDEEISVISEPFVIENWDQDGSYTPHIRNPNVDSDDDWTGEEVTKKERRDISSEKVYVLDEDWMFEDVPEI